jgi:transposase
MTEHTPVSKISRLEVIETGSRRRWTPEEKQRIVAESFGAPRIVSATARRHGLSTSQLFTWRRLAREGKLISEADEAAFVPAVVLPELAARGMADAPAALRPETSPRPSDENARATGRMEIVLSGTRRVIVGSDVDAEALLRIIGVLDRR